MGWLGTLFVGAIVGLAGYAMQQFSGRKRFGQGVMAVALAAIAALLVKMLGNITGLLIDGSLLEWLFAVSAAIVTVPLIGIFVGRQRIDP